MNIQHEQALQFHQLHTKGDPLVLINIWDAGSAQAVQDIGAKAIATGSWSVATAHGYEDGEALPFPLVLENLKRIKDKVDLPVTIDIEGGYGLSPDDVKVNVGLVIEKGAVGINLEDQRIGEEGLYTTSDQCLRIAAARAAGEQANLPLFINARTDIFFQTAAGQHASCIEQTLSRAHAYAEAGADGIFVPGLSDARLIETLCSHSPLPVNIMVTSHTPALRQLAELGVARISYGPLPYFEAMNALKEVGLAALSLQN
ncbi:phosphonomutase [Bacillus sp. FJAT-27264]|uniref:isocitrate lyase/PEP mutase family protein n=1 Tax=Paenibacillus sp. (strain DSM 101736 / FJAT-27264) TaxID=1850362 RepID=UPI000807E9D6|nr:isocitrate lyase/phosphoenolpyruvate mutase family protein [Bacillus sp. FJAT-27264]OBZ08390.1 phosphonomutase [Bacillus sp. FJAT-27264]